MRIFPALLPMVSAALLGSVPAQAHEGKSYDMNGGHYDDGGFYHCHQDGCVETASRNQFRSRGMNRADFDIFYNPEDWPYWQLAEGCKTIRTVVLETTSKVPVTWTNPRQCEIREGLWVDEYTGEEFTRAAQMEIDHIIPPQYANATNGYRWDYDKRVGFANDPYNLIPVSRETHRKKRERGIGDWEPREDFACEYAQNWRDVAEKYDLDLFGEDSSRIKKVMEGCEPTAPAAVEQ
ncbi:MAG: DUF1524 domain-containing protein [Pseudomonadota bacterium]